DLHIPNQLTWEPYYCQELDWVLTESIRRHMTFDNEGRSGVHIRSVTRGAEQKDFMKRLKTQSKFKVDNLELHHPNYPIIGATNQEEVQTLADTEILESVRKEVLEGAYYLINYENYAGYEPGDNVVNIFSMGSPTTEAIKASDMLLEKGIYANVIVVTSNDLLIGNQAHEDNYNYLRNQLGVDHKLHLHGTEGNSAAEFVGVAGRKIPVVSVHDGEPGLLDNIGSILGTKQECLAVRKHSKCGRPSEVYAFHSIDEQAIVEASGKALSETALETIQVAADILGSTNSHQNGIRNWRELWPELQKN
ncbi:MAG: pyruvate dehydrogenase, partial [Bdellovibrionales bacterium]